VSGVLGRQIYYPASRRWGTFVIWNRERQEDLSPERLWREAEDLGRQHGRDVLVLLNYELPVEESGAVLAKKFTGSICPEENYYLYRVVLPGGGRRTNDFPGRGGEGL
jgi:hypothetical protein